MTDSKSEWYNLYASRMKNLSSSQIRDLLKLLDDPNIVSFAGGVPNPEVFPLPEMQEAMQELFADQKQFVAALQYFNTEGYKPLREWLCDYMGKLGVKVSIDNILITSGSQQALDYLSKLFISENDAILLDYPTYLGALQAFGSYEASYLRLFDENGDVVSKSQILADNPDAKIKFAYLSSDFSNPAGKTISRSQRDDLISLADSLNCAIIEDGAYQELRYEGQAIPPILALEYALKGDIEACKTIYCGSFSKTVTPGLRIGWVVANSKVIQDIGILKQSSDLHTAPLNQMLMYKYISKSFDKQVEKVKTLYSGNRDLMLASLQKYMPSWVKWDAPEGGMFVWLSLPEHIDSSELLYRSLETCGVAFVPGQAFFADGTGQNNLRLSYSLLNPQKMEEGIQQFAALLIKEYSPTCV